MGPQSHGVRECNGLPATENIETVSVSEEHLGPWTLPEEAFTYLPDGDDVLVRLSSGLVERRVHENVDFTTEESESLERLRAEAWQSGARFCPEVCREATRYLSAARGNHEKALRLMQATDSWRRSYFKDGPLRSQDLAEDLSHGFAYFVGRDRAMRPALVFRASRVPAEWRKNYDAQRLLRSLIFCMEVLLRFMLVPGRVETSCLIVDLQNISTKDIPISLFREIHQLFTAHYPCRGFRFYVCNVPGMLMAMSPMARSLLTERQKLKVLVLHSVSELLKDFAPHQLEKDLGGSRPLATSFLPFPLQPGPFEPNAPGPRRASLPNLHSYSCQEAARLALHGHSEGKAQVMSSDEETIPGKSALELASPDSFGSSPSTPAFREGDLIDVWSSTRNAWQPGAVEAFFAQSTIAEGFQVPAGTIKAIFATGAKWIPPDRIESDVRRAPNGRLVPHIPNGGHETECANIASQGRVLLSASLSEDMLALDERCCELTDPKRPALVISRAASPETPDMFGCRRQSWFCL